MQLFSVDFEKHIWVVFDDALNAGVASSRSCLSGSLVCDGSRLLVLLMCDSNLYRVRSNLSRSSTFRHCSSGHAAFTLSSRKEKSDETGAEDGEILRTVANGEGGWLVTTVEWVAPFVLISTRAISEATRVQTRNGHTREGLGSESVKRQVMDWDSSDPDVESLRKVSEIRTMVLRNTAANVTLMLTVAASRVWSASTLRYSL